MDQRYPTIQWTNRNGRGWSVGQTQTDPRTGEILHAVVQLDSHRVRTVNNYWNAVPHAGSSAADDAGLDLFSGLDNADPSLSEDEVMLRRIALLTCHEMGHVLGLEHNFAASTFNRGSVMDYFAPRITIRKDGTADLSDAYMQGVGSYDRFAIEWGYSTNPQPQSADPEGPQERARLQAIVLKALRQGIFWANYDDPRWNSYDDGADPVSWLKQVIPVRNALLASYGPQMLRRDEPASTLAARLALVYLFHRYALSSAMNVVGGAKTPPALSGDGQKPLEVWSPASQREALRLALQELAPDQLEIPANLWSNLVQYDNRGLDPESYRSSAGPVFSPYDAARSVAEAVFDPLIEAQRFARLEAIHHFQPSAPSTQEVINILVQNVFGAGTAGLSARGSASTRLFANDLASVVQDELADHLMALAVDDNATPEVKAEAWAGVRSIYARVRQLAANKSAARANLERKIEAFIRDPKQNAPKTKPSGAPAGPPI